MNQLNIIGNVSLEPTYRTVETVRGTSTVCSFSVAVNEYYQGKESTTYFRVSLWNALADRASKVLTLGAMVFVSGKVKVSNYTDRNSNERTSLEITGRDFYLLRKNQNSEVQNRREDEYKNNNKEKQTEEYVDLRNQEIKNPKVEDLSFQDSVFGRKAGGNKHVAPSGTNKYHSENKSYESNFNVRKEDLKNDEGDDYE